MPYAMQQASLLVSENYPRIVEEYLIHPIARDLASKVTRWAQLLFAHAIMLFRALITFVGFVFDIVGTTSIHVE